MAKKTKENISNLPSKDGNYNLFNTKEEIVYTGQGNIKDRISAHSKNQNITFTSYTFNLESSAKKREHIEEQRIKRYKPPLNKQKK
jgi:excinuclease UvrABC nuclease subunit